MKVELLSNFDINRLGLMLNLNIRQIVSKNQIRKIPYQNEMNFYVLNLDNDTGSHWVCMAVYNNQCYYFDSFGIAPPVEVENFACKYKLSLNYNKTQIQSLTSTCCGYFCLAWMYFINTNYNTYSFFQKQNDFDKLNSKFIQKSGFNIEVQEYNDKILQSIIRQILF